MASLKLAALQQLVGFATLCAIFGSRISTITAQPTDLAGVLEPFRTSAGIPALGAAVWQSGQLSAIGVTGVRKQGGQTPVQVTDQWHLGSDTKAMTAYLFGLQVDKGLVSFTSTIQQVFSNETIHETFQNVTMQQLLWHQAGLLADVTDDIADAEWSQRGPDGLRWAVLSTLRRPRPGPLGALVYSNIGYMTIGLAIEYVTGATWWQLIQSQLWTPLGMVSCGMGAPGSGSSVTEPWGHDLENGVYVPIAPDSRNPVSDNPSGDAPAGGAHCGLADWGKFLDQIVAGVNGKRSILMSASTFKQLMTPAPHSTYTGIYSTAYAGGWWLVSRPWANGTAYTHEGTNTLWEALAWVTPGLDAAFAAVTNSYSGDTPDLLDPIFDPLINLITNDDESGSGSGMY